MKRTIGRDSQRLINSNEYEMKSHARTTSDEVVEVVAAITNEDPIPGYLRDMILTAVGM